jgi:hypothetical protein
MGGRRTLPAHQCAAGRTIQPGGSDEQGAGDEKDWRSRRHRRRAIREEGKRDRRSIHCDRGRKCPGERCAKRMSFRAERDGESLGDSPVAAACVSKSRASGNLLLGAVRDFYSRVTAKKPRTSDDWRGRQAEKHQRGNYATQHRRRLTGQDSFCKRSNASSMYAKALRCRRTARLHLP